MPERIAVNTVHVIREGKTVVVKPGTKFNFEANELADIKLLAPDSVRHVVNEAESDADREAREQDELDEFNRQQELQREAATAAKGGKNGKGKQAATNDTDDL